jgi:tRNA(Ile)-lysidine synthase
MTRARPGQARQDAERATGPSTRRNFVPELRNTKAESQSSLLERVRDEGLLAADRPVVVLLSGGRDSTCLLDLAARIAGPPSVTGLHLNYGLRPESDQDEAHCQSLAEALGVALHVRRPSRPAVGNVQAWARELRYGAAAALAEELAADIAAGHTATDQVETILYRLASSPSRRALLGMKPREGRLVRPLLAFTRQDTADYCSERGLRWREDQSNQSDAYARARIRSRLVPALREVHPAAEENVLALAEILREEAQVLDDLVGIILLEREQIPMDELRAVPLPVARLVVQRLADAAVGRPAPGTARRVQEILGLGPNAALDLPHGVRAVTQRGVLRFERQASGAP